MNFDPEARRVLYDKYAAQMYSVCLRYVKGADDANDIFQQGFYLVYKNIGQLKNVDALSGWIKSIFIHAALKQNQKSNQLFYLDDYELSDNYSSDNWNEALSNLETDELTRLIQQLPEGCRTVFNLFVIDGYSHNEIAKRLSISVGTSKSQLHDARKFLKRRIICNSTIKTT